jgi:hypothetical protein
VRQARIDSLFNIDRSPLGGLTGSQREGPVRHAAPKPIGQVRNSMFKI